MVFGNSCVTIMGYYLLFTMHPINNKCIFKTRHWLSHSELIEEDIINKNVPLFPFKVTLSNIQKLPTLVSQAISVSPLRMLWTAGNRKPQFLLLKSGIFLLSHINEAQTWENSRVNQSRQLKISRFPGTRTWFGRTGELGPLHTAHSWGGELPSEWGLSSFGSHTRPCSQPLCQEWRCYLDIFPALCLSLSLNQFIIWSGKKDVICWTSSNSSTDDKYLTRWNSAKVTEALLSWINSIHYHRRWSIMNGVLNKSLLTLSTESGLESQGLWVQDPNEREKLCFSSKSLVWHFKIQVPKDSVHKMNTINQCFSNCRL